MRTFLIAGVLCMIISLIAIITFIWLHVGTGGHIPFDYGIVMDAGSSHTEALVYKWSSDKLNGTGIVKEQANCQTHIGIDDNEANTNITIQDLMPCIDEVTDAIVVEGDYQKETPVYLGATAGMRILNVTKPEISQLIFVTLENALLRYKHGKTILHVKTFRIIEGREEALYAWITANYLSGLIPNLGRKHPEMKNISSIGILDMGGASAQIAYEVSKEHLIHFTPSEIQKVRLYGHKFNVRGESNLCLGGDEILKRHRVLQIIANRGATTIEDPCNNGDTSIEVKGETLQTVCTEAASESDKLLKSDQTYEFKGKYDERKCSQLLEENIDPNNCKKKLKFCFVGEKHAPPANTVIYAISNYFYSTSVLNISETTFEEFTSKTNEYCAHTNDQLKRMPINQKFALDYCFKLNSIKKVLSILYKFREEQWSNLRFTSKINGQSLGWALGFMIHETNLIPGESPSDAVIETKAFVILLIISLLLLVFAIFLILKWKRGSKERRIPATAKEQHALKDHNRNDV